MKDEVISAFARHWGEAKVEPDVTDKNIINRIVEEAKRYLKRQYGNDTPDIDKIFTDYNNKFPKSDELVVSLSNFYLVHTLKDIISRPDILSKSYLKLQENKKFFQSDITYHYTADMSNNYEIIAHDIFNNYTNSKGKKYKIEDVASLSREETTYIIEQLKYVYKELASKMTNSYIRGITNFISILNDLGVLNSQLEKNNRDRRLMGLEVLEFSFEKQEGGLDYSISDLGDEKILSKLPFEKLILLHAFYSNRLKKVAENLGAGLFILSKTEGFSQKEVELNSAFTAYRQYNALRSIYRDAVPKISKSKDSYTQKDIYVGDRYVALNASKIYDDFFSRYRDIYSLFSGKNEDMEDDYFKFTSLEVTDYWQKDSAMETIIYIALSSFGNDNWGYIPEMKQGQNSIERNKEHILLGFDIEGFNVPVRLHFPLKKLREFFKKTDRSYEIPNYIGNEDMELWERNIGASILMPLSPHHRKRLISAIKKMNPKSAYYNFGRHIECMQYSNNLRRIEKWKNPNGRNKGRTYTNLLTGKEISFGRESY